MSCVNYNENLKHLKQIHGCHSFYTFDSHRDLILIIKLEQHKFKKNKYKNIK